MSHKPPEGPDGPDDPMQGPPDEQALEAAAREAQGLWQDTPELREQRAEQKRKLLSECLERGKTQVRLDARRPGCRVPDDLADECQLVLNLSWRFAHADMVINDRGVAATLRFGGEPFRCVVPWTALWGLLAPGSDQLRVWPVDLPEELGGPERSPDEEAPLPVEPMRPRLSVIEREAPLVEPASGLCAVTPSREPLEPPPPTASAESTMDGEAPAKPRAPWLRVVK